MTGLLARSSRRHMLRHPWQLILSLVGVALGVAVVIAVDQANESASRAFLYSMESVTGRATHQIVGGTAGIPDALYTELRVEAGVRAVAPVVEGYVASLTEPARSLHLLGIDPFAEEPFRSHLASLSDEGGARLATLLIEPASVLVSERLAAELGLAKEIELRLRTGSLQKSMAIAGIFKSEEDARGRALTDIVLTDIATAQELLGLCGRLSRIDLILPEGSGGDRLREMITSRLPAGIRLIRSDTRSQSAEQMISAFQLNLSAMSLLALIVGMFLIFNTMTFSVVQRRRQIGLLRTLGVTRREIFTLILGEALLLSLVGTLLGTLLGVLLSRNLTGLVSQAINDLYFVLTVRGVAFSWTSLAKGWFLGVGATLVASLKPAWEATTEPAGLVLRRSLEESRMRRRIPRLSVAGMLCLLLGAAILAFPSRRSEIGFVGILVLILGFALLTPVAVTVMMGAVGRLTGATPSLLARMASRGVVSQLSRTALPLAALALAVSAVVGVGVMISSFRLTVVHWLETRLSADLYVYSPSGVHRRNNGSLECDWPERIARLPGVASCSMYREIEILQEEGRSLRVIGTAMGPESRAGFRFASGDPRAIWPAFLNEGAVLVTEPFAFHNQTAVGDRVTIATDRGRREFEVAGIYYDYSSDNGLVLMSYDTFRRYWDDDRVSGVSVYAREGVDLDRLTQSIRSLTIEDEEILVRSNRALRETSIEIFDRTFLIARVLEVLAVFVAFVGILSSLMALQLERGRELGVLRAVGLTPRQLWKLVTVQTGLMGLVAGFLALPLGNVLAWVLIYIINRRSFGWTLQFRFMVDVMGEALLLALAAALLAGIYPGFKMARTSPALALREE